jgi:hypothetical protein
MVFKQHRIMCVNNIHTQVRHHRGMEKKEEEEPQGRSLEALQKKEGGS